MGMARFENTRGPRAFRKASRQLYGAFALVGGFSMFANLLLLAAPLYMLQVYDRVLTSRSQETLLYLTLIALSAFAAYAALDFIRSRILVVVAGWLDRHLRGSVLDASLAAGRKGVKTPAGVLRKVTTLRSTLSGSTVQPLMDAPWTPIFVGALFLLHPLLGWVIIAGALTLFILALLNEWVTNTVLKDAEQASGQAELITSEALRNADAVNAMGMMSGLRSRLEYWNGDTLTLLDRASKRSGFISAVSRFLRYGLQIAVLGLGAMLTLENEITAGAIIAASILSARALAPVDMAISSWRSIAAGRQAFKDIRHALTQTVPGETSTQLPRPEGRIDVEHVTVAPGSGQRPTLSNVSLSLPAGGSLGIIGPTASGKTTLARILVGSLAPSSGHARLDGADMAQWACEDRGAYVGYLPQAVELFPGTIRDNIARLGDGDDAEVINAARDAGVHDVILTLPEGYDTQIGPGGAELSGGQRQQIALARALFGDPVFVVLDEPNANLDRQGEDKLLEALARLRARGITIVMISHRPNVMRAVDSLLVLKDGQVAAFGPRDAVLEQVTHVPEQRAIAK